MSTETKNLSRSQLVGMLASLRGIVYDLTIGFERRQVDREPTLAEARELLDLTAGGASDEDLVDGGFDMTWRWPKDAAPNTTISNAEGGEQPSNADVASPVASDAPPSAAETSSATYRNALDTIYTELVELEESLREEFNETPRAERRQHQALLLHRAIEHSKYRKQPEFDERFMPAAETSSAEIERLRAQIADAPEHVRAACKAFEVQCRADLVASARALAQAHEATRDNALEDCLHDVAVVHDAARFALENFAWKISGDDQKPAPMMGLTSSVRAQERLRWIDAMLAQAMGSDDGPGSYTKHWAIATRGWAQRLAFNDPMYEGAVPVSTEAMIRADERRIERQRMVKWAADGYPGVDRAQAVAFGPFGILAEFKDALQRMLDEVADPHRDAADGGPTT